MGHEGIGAPAPYGFTVSPHRWPVGLVAVAVVLLAVHAALTVYHYRVDEITWLVRQLFDVDEENNLPSWFSGFLLLNPAFFLWLCARRKRAEGDPWSRHWQILALGFLLLSIDEVAGLHESVNSSIEMSWAWGGGLIAAVGGLAYLPFLRALPRRTAVGFVVAGLLFVGGAVGVELYTDRFADARQLDTLAYNLWTLPEEGLEMGAVILFVAALLAYMRDDGRDPAVGVTAG